MSLLPWNLVLQILLLPLYLWLLVGKVVRTSASTLLGSVGLYLLAPFALASYSSAAHRKGRCGTTTSVRRQSLLVDVRRQSGVVDVRRHRYNVDVRR